MSAQGVRDAGFPRVANLLERDNVRAAWRELRSFEPCSMGEVYAKDRARAEMPEYCEDDEDGGAS